MTENPKKPSEPKRLGRGLSSLLGEVPIAPAASENSSGKPARPADSLSSPGGASSGNQVRSLPIEWINPGPWQPRQIFEADALAELAVSIRQRGLIQPILVRENPKKPSRYELIAGERRWRAAQLAKLHEIPAIISELSDKEAGELSLIENIQRQDLSVIEEADGYQRLIDNHNYTQETLSGIIGKSRSHIANLLRLRQLPGSVKAMLAAGSLSMGQARPLIGHPDAAELADKIVRQNLSARAVEALVKSGKGAASSKIPVQKPADIRALEVRAQTELGLSVSIDWDAAREKGKLSVSLASLDQFDDLLKRLKLM
ncbi:MAG: ParB/RepB/Spo0J family partition protein [Candidatus Puniceispirillaceae bacterium]